MRPFIPVVPLLLLGIPFVSYRDPIGDRQRIQGIVNQLEEELLVPEMISIGSLMIQSRLLSLIAAVIIGYFVVIAKLRLIQAPQPAAGKMMDKFINAVILAVFVWKFSPVLTTPSLLWKQPLSLLA